jgi:hypothetical protein
MASSGEMDQLVGKLGMSSIRKIHDCGTTDGWHGAIEEGGQFPPEKGRYHLYIGAVPFNVEYRFYCSELV